MLGHEGGNLDLWMVAVVFKLCTIPIGACKTVRSQSTLLIGILALYRVIFLIYSAVTSFSLVCVVFLLWKALHRCLWYLMLFHSVFKSRITSALQAAWHPAASNMTESKFAWSLSLLDLLSWAISFRRTVFYIWIYLLTISVGSVWSGQERNERDLYSEVNNFMHWHSCSFGLASVVKPWVFVEELP